MTAPELKPCPFCGGDAEFERRGNSRQSTIVTCNDCGASLENGEEWGHGCAWNTRADHDRLIAEAVAAERERCAKMVEDNFGVITDRKVSWKPDVMLSVAAAIREGK